MKLSTGTAVERCDPLLTVQNSATPHSEGSSLSVDAGMWEFAANTSSQFGPNSTAFRVELAEQS